MYMSYVKPLFDEAWDNFQLNMIKVGGNKRFFEFLKEYGKEREPINKKYDNSASMFYRRKLCAQSKNLPFSEPAPSKNA